MSRIAGLFWLHSWHMPLAYFVRHWRWRSLKLTLFFTVSLCFMLFANQAATETSLAWQPLNEPGIGGRIDSIAVSPHSSGHILAGGDILGAHLSTDYATSWDITTGWLSYEVSDFTWHPQDPNTIWAGSLSGPHLSTDGGKTWAAKRAGLPKVDPGKYTAPVEKILFDPDSRDILAFGGDHRQLRAEGDLLNYGAVWQSSNDGESWYLRSEIAKNGNVMSAAYAGKSANEIYAAVWNHGAFYSDDDGKSWTPRSNGLPINSSGNILISDLEVHPNDPKTLWATVEDAGIYKTTNGGDNWQLLSRGLPSEGTAFWSIVAAADGQTLYAGNKDYSRQPGVYKSTDGGSHWRYIFYDESQIVGRQKPYPGGISPWWLEIDPANQNIIYAGTDNTIYRSENGGEQWQLLSGQQTSQGWQGNGFSGLVARNIEWNPDNTSHVVLQGMDGAKAIQSWDGGDRWRVDNPGLPSYSGGSDIAFSGGTMFGVFGQSGEDTSLIARSHDTGQTWTTLSPPVQASEAKRVHTDTQDPNRLWVVINQQLWYSPNANQSTAPLWTQIAVGFSDNKVGDLEAVPGDRDAFYVSTDNGVYHTEDGVDFTPIGGLEGARAVELAIAPSAPHTLYAFQDNPAQPQGLWRYSQSSNVWSSVLDEPSVTAHIGDLAVHPTNPDVLALITNDLPYHDKNWATGVWISKDGGDNWRQENAGLPMLRGDAIAFHPNGEQLVVGLNGAGFYTTAIENK